MSIATYKFTPTIRLPKPDSNYTSGYEKCKFKLESRGGDKSVFQSKSHTDRHCSPTQQPITPSTFGHRRRACLPRRHWLKLNPLLYVTSILILWSGVAKAQLGATATDLDKFYRGSASRIAGFLRAAGELDFDFDEQGRLNAARIKARIRHPLSGAVVRTFLAAAGRPCKMPLSRTPRWRSSRLQSAFPPVGRWDIRWWRDEMTIGKVREVTVDAKTGTPLHTSDWQDVSVLLDSISWLREDRVWSRLLLERSDGGAVAIIDATANTSYKRMSIDSIEVLDATEFLNRSLIALTTVIPDGLAGNQAFLEARYVGTYEQALRSVIHPSQLNKVRLARLGVLTSVAINSPYVNRDLIDEASAQFPQRQLAKFLLRGLARTKGEVLERRIRLLGATKHFPAIEPLINVRLRTKEEAVTAACDKSIQAICDASGFHTIANPDVGRGEWLVWLKEFKKHQRKNN